MAVSGQREIKPGKTDDKHVEGKNDSKKHELQAEFRIGEQVLCYEPDPTKAKMLYEAKVKPLFKSRICPNSKMTPSQINQFYLTTTITYNMILYINKQILKNWVSASCIVLEEISIIQR